MEASIERLKGEHQSVEQRLEYSEKELSTLRLQKGEIELQIAELAENLNDDTDERANLTLQIEKLQQEYEQEHAAAEQKLTSQVAGSAARMKQKTVEFEAELGKLNQEQALCKEQLVVVQQERDSTAVRLVELEEKDRARSASIADLQQELSELRQDEMKWRTSKGGLEAQLIQLETDPGVDTSKLQESFKKNHQLQIDHKVLEKQITNLENQTTELSRNGKDSSAKYEAVCLQLQQQKAQSDLERSSLTSQFAVLQQEHTLWRDQLVAAQQERDGTAIQLAELEGKDQARSLVAENLRSDLALLREQKSNWVAQTATLETDIRELQNERGEVQQKISSLEDEIQNSKLQKEELRRQFAELAQKNIQAHELHLNQNQELRQQIVSLETEIARLTNALSLQTNERASLVMQISEMQMQLDENIMQQTIALQQEELLEQMRKKTHELEMERASFQQQQSAWSEQLSTVQRSRTDSSRARSLSRSLSPYAGSTASTNQRMGSPSTRSTSYSPSLGSSEMSNIQKELNELRVAQGMWQSNKISLEARIAQLEEIVASQPDGMTSEVAKLVNTVNTEIAERETLNRQLLDQQALLEQERTSHTQQSARQSRQIAKEKRMKLRAVC